MSADRNLLFGILAVQLDFVTRDALIDAMNAWRLDKARPLGEVLRDRGALSDEELRHLSALVALHLKRHGDDPRQSLAALPPAEATLQQTLAAVPDDEMSRTLRQVVASRDPGGAGRPPQPPAAAPPAGVRYRVLRPHARGGLGEVFVAEDTELGRQVALKEIQGRYADDEGSRSRFVLEAEITGGLEHPGIVPVYGLGTYGDGRPFYAMRFIKGDNLKDALQRFHGATPDFAAFAFRDLLRRFIDVCNAVAYAHSRGVLHRDLKPGNVMLGQFGETLVVDWGLAKALGRSEPFADGDATLVPRSGDSSAATAAGEALGTPAYMSPEQAAGRPDDLGAATDVYSLGATLYEVLTGRTAFHNLPTVMDVLERVAAGEFPPPRAVQPAAPPALEAVCLKAMALAPADRYPSATALAQDVERWLADEPVTAYPEPLGARVRRRVRRHARLVTGVAATLGVGAIALGVVAWQQGQKRAAVAAEQAETARQRDRANAERDAAQTQKRRTRAALDTMVSAEMVERLGSQKELTPGQREFLQAALGYYKEFAAEAATEEAGRTLEANAHSRVAYLLQSLGQHADAEAPLRAAVAAYERLAADDPAVPDHRRGLARSHNNLGLLLRDLGRRADAEAALRAAVTAYARLAADHPAEPDYRRGLAASHTNLGLVLRDLGRRAEAEAASRAALAEYARLVADHPAVPDFRRELATSHNNLGLLLAALGRRAEAEAASRAALAVLARLVADHPAVPDYRRELGRSHSSLANLLSDLGRRAEAEAEFRTSLNVLERLVADHPAVPDYRRDLAFSHHSLGFLLRDLGRRADAEAAFRAALGVRERLAADHPAVPAYRRELAFSQTSLALLLRDSGRPADAEAAFRAALALREKLASDHPDVPADRASATTSALNLSLLLVNHGQAAEAVAIAGRIAAGPGPAADRLYDCACVFALASAAASAPDDAAHAARAVELLRLAVARGYRDVPNLLADADLASLRRRDDFATLLWGLADGLPPAR